MAVTISLPLADEALEADAEPLFSWKLLAEQAAFAYLRRHAEHHLPGEAQQPPLKLEGQERDWQPGDFVEVLGEYRERAESVATKKDADAFAERAGRVKLEPLEDESTDSHVVTWTATIRLPAVRAGANEKETTARYPVRLPASLVPKQVVDYAKGLSPEVDKVKRARKLPEALPYSAAKPRQQTKAAKPKVRIKRH